MARRNYPNGGLSHQYRQRHAPYFILVQMVRDVAIAITKAIDMLNDGIKPEIKYDRNSIADLCKQGYFTPFIEFVGGASPTTQIDLDFEQYDKTPPKLTHPAHTNAFIYHTELQTLVRYPHKTIAIQYGQIIDPYTMEIGELIRLAPHSYFDPEMIGFMDYYYPDYRYEATANELLFSERQIQNHIDIINSFDDLTATDTPADDEMKGNEKTAVTKLLYALMREVEFAIDGKRKGAVNDNLQNLTKAYGAGVSEDTIAKWLDRINELHTDRQKTTKI